MMTAEHGQGKDSDTLDFRTSLTCAAASGNWTAAVRASAKSAFLFATSASSSTICAYMHARARVTMAFTCNSQQAQQEVFSFQFWNRAAAQCCATLWTPSRLEASSLES